MERTPSNDPLRQVIMPDTTEVEEHIRELLLNDNKVHDMMTDLAKRDLQARGFFPEHYREETWEELVCMGQTRFLTMILGNVQNWLLG